MLFPPSLKRLSRRCFPGVYRALYRYTYSRDEPAERTISAGRLAGRRFICRPLLEGHYLAGSYEADVQVCVEKYIRPGMVVYDVGVHRGYFSLLFADLVGPSGKVIGFEPLPGNLALAQQTVGLNPDLADRIRFVPVAVSDVIGVSQLAEVEQFSSMAKLVESNLGEGEVFGQIVVNTTSLDDFVRAGNPPPQFVKMDIEGAETKALMGMADIFRLARPTVLVELHNEAAWIAFKTALCEYSYLGAKVSDSDFSTAPPWTGKDQYLAIPADAIMPKSGELG